jgi:tetratricopeptide (TPR) repeat protein
VTDIKLEMYDKAEAKLSFLANVCPNESNSFEYARLKAIKDDFENAIHYAKKSLEFNPNMLPAYILLGQLYAKCSEKENCLNIFQIAENKNLITADLYLEWGKALQQFEIFDVALEKLQKAFELDSENVETLATLGFCYVIKKDFEKAEPLLNKVLEKDANNSKVKQTLGIIAYEHGEIAKAISIFQCDDENAINCYYLAKCFENQNNDIRTVDYYEAAIRLNPQYTTAYADYINYLISKGEISEAQRKLRKALKLDENNIKLLNLMFNVSYILVKDKVCEYNVKETLAVAKKIEDINPSLFEYPEQKQELINILKEI